MCVGGLKSREYRLQSESEDREKPPKQSPVIEFHAGEALYAWPDYIPWDNQTRFEQIAAYLSRLPAPVPWLAIDDDDRGWPNTQRSNLVHTDGMLGLSAADAQAELISWLQRLNNALHP